MTRCSIPVAPSENLFRDHADISASNQSIPQAYSNNATVQVHIPRLQCFLPLYSSDDAGNLIPNWSAFLLRAAKGDSLAMKTICILAKSQRFERTENDYLLYQKVIEAVQSEMSSPNTLSLEISVMIFYAILALAIQAGFMNGQSHTTMHIDDEYKSSVNEPAIHLNAAGYMLGRINIQTRQQGCHNTLKQLVDFFNVANYLLALSRCSQSEIAAWPLLMYHLIVQ